MNRVEQLRKKLAKGQGVYISSYANIFYYSGFTSEDAVLIITPQRQLLVTDSRYLVQAKEQAPEFEIRDIAKGLSAILSDIEGLQELYFEEDYLTVSREKRLQDAGKNLQLTQGQKLISALREKKDEKEIEKIRAAEALGDAAFSHILNFIRVGQTEREVALELEFFMRKQGAQALSFETIVASGVRSCMPHGVATNKVIEAGDFVTLDFGCILDGYCSDMTRTFVMGHASEKQRQIYDVVLAAQKAALDKIAIGVACRDIDRAARDVIASAGFGKNFGHGLGHSVGIEIHESPSFSPKSDAIVEEGHVITVEPGIYLEGFGGVRIEDVVAISAKNVANLTKSQKDFIIL
ncbi:MAG: aminopeptidase P family protein [Ruminococcaceae bacterium]|nr:aminopeptidase P family protein [Oscillospiraceae bacterium]